MALTHLDEQAHDALDTRLAGLLGLLSTPIDHGTLTSHVEQILTDYEESVLHPGWRDAWLSEERVYTARGSSIAHRPALGRTNVSTPSSRR